jgi:hypothetical protein
MIGKTAAVLLSGLLVACAQTQPSDATAPSATSTSAGSAPAQAPAAEPPPQAAAPEPVPADRIVSIRGAGCEDLLQLSPEDRAAASMFYIGYQAARIRARTINVSLIPSIEAQAVTYCSENPRRTVAQVFAEAYSRTGR